ncbi:MAG: hypothetical protein K8T89_09750 [Planctomycetes bacterium]|nr:hypothetical protein [Planctomycetota bacterium]
MKRSPNYRFFAGFLILLSPAFAAAQAFVENITPPVIQRGQKTLVTFVGNDLAGALDVWNSLPAGALKAKAIESEAGRAVFELETTADAPVGLCGLRIATKDGLGNAHLFLIDDLPVKPGVKKDETLKIALPACVWGTFREAAADRYQIDVKAGQSVSFEAVGSRFGKDADPLITIRDSKGKWIAERDNDQGLYYDCRFEHQFKEAGTYTVEIRDSRFQGSPYFHYALRIGRFPVGRVAIPSAVRTGGNHLLLPENAAVPLAYTLAANTLPGPFLAALKGPSDEGSTWLPLATTEDGITIARDFDENLQNAQMLSVSPATTLYFNLSPLRANPFLPLNAMLHVGRAQATPAAVPGVLCGVLRKPGQRQVFMVELAKGQSIWVRGEAQALNSPVDLEIGMIDKSGREIRRGTEKGGESTFEFTANLPGFYGLTVRDVLRDGGDAFAYRLTVSDKPFPPTLVAEVEGLTVPRGSFQPVPITITRTGTTGPIKLKLLGAPPGVKLTPDEIDEKELTVICKLEADANTPLGINTIQIVAETSSGPTLVRTQPLIDKLVHNVDLIQIALRDDQKRLPPSLNDRFAVQITPASPFTLELPEAEVTLVRYLNADVPIVTTRVADFKDPITFKAKGGQLAPKTEGRTRVYADLPDATAKDLRVTGSVHSKILSNLGKSRIELIATGSYQDRRVTLRRTFDLTITSAYKVTTEPMKLALLPGEASMVRVQVERLKPFDDEVMVRFNPFPGLTHPSMVVVPKGQNGVTIEVKADADAMPRKQALQFNSSGTVNSFEEELRGSLVEIEIRKVEPPKKVEVPKKK